MFALSVLAALGHLSQRERQGTGVTDSHASDIGHWLGMTGQKQGAGAVDDCRCGALPRPNVTIPPSRLRRDTSLAEGGGEIPRLRARRGDEGIALYGREQGVRSQNGGRGTPRALVPLRSTA